MNRPFADRREAGRILSRQLISYAGRDDVIVLGLPRGGVPVAFEAAQALNAPLDVFLVRKLGAPGHEELAMGAIASGGVVVVNDEVVRALKISSDTVMAEVESEREELTRREAIYRSGRPPARCTREDRDPGRRWVGYWLDHARGGHRATTKRAGANRRCRARRRRLDLCRVSVDRR